MTIGERIRARRLELGLTQLELAERMGYASKSSINKIELDNYNLPQSKIKAIADALLTTPSYIMGWNDPDEKTNPVEPQPDEVEEVDPIDLEIADAILALPKEKKEQALSFLRFLLSQ